LQETAPKTPLNVPRPDILGRLTSVPSSRHELQELLLLVLLAHGEVDVPCARKREGEMVFELGVDAIGATSCSYQCYDVTK
jgi:hypothetical protein